MRAVLLLLLLAGPAAAKDPLMEALGDPARLEPLLKERKPKTAHLEAALRGWPSSRFVTSAKLLLKAGAKPPKGESEQYHALWDAVKASDAELVKMLLAAGVKADALRAKKETPHTALMDAAYCGGLPEHPDVLAALLEGGADPKSRAALETATAGCCLRHMTLLLDRGANVRHASPSRSLCPEAARLLTERGYTWSAYDAATFAAEGDTRTAHVILDSTGVPKESWNEFSARPALRRALFGLPSPDLPLAERIVALGGGAALSGCRYDDPSLLQLAAQSKDPGPALFLLQHGASPDWVCEKGDKAEPLDTALCRSPEVVRALLKAGARPTRERMISAIRGHHDEGCPLEHARLLLDAGAPVDDEIPWQGTVFATVLATYAGRDRKPEPELLDAFLARKPRLNGLQEDSPLYQVLLWPEVASRLMRAGANLDERRPSDGLPLLFRLCWANDGARRLRTALALGADPNTALPTGETLLMRCAIYTGGDQSVKALLAAGADPGQVDALGRTALDLAVAAEKLEAAHLLRAAAKPASAPAKPGAPPADPAALKQLVAQAVADSKKEATSAAPAPVVSDVDKPGYANPEDPDAYAVVVGVEEYSELPKAPFAERDAAAVRRHFKALGVPDRNLVLLSGAKAVRSALAKYLESWLPNNVSARSRVYFYFSGHGAPDPSTGKAFLMPWDGDASFLADTAYPIERLYKTLDALKAKQVLVALDACFSGAGGRSVLPEGARPLVAQVQKAPTGRLIVLAATQPDQITGVIKEQGHGIFTYHFLKGLSGAAAGPDGKVTPASLHGYLKPRVQDEARRQNREQTPSLSGPETVVLRAR